MHEELRGERSLLQQRTVEHHERTSRKQAETHVDAANANSRQLATHAQPQFRRGNVAESSRDEVAQLILRTVEEYAPGFRESVIAVQAFSPLDLERTFGLIGGDIMHGRLELDQMFSARPVLGHGNYRAPIRGLYMCSAGTHPGGGVSGIPGHNAAREILRDLRRGRARL